MWARLRPHLKQYDPVRIEDSVGLGTPDVNLKDGQWIELKQIRAWPRRADSLVQVPHFRAQQRTWLTRRCRAGGAAYLLLHVAESDDWVFFKGEAAAMLLGRVPKSRLLVHATLITVGITDDLIRLIVSPDHGA